jgi:hypothetical protein
VLSKYCGGSRWLTGGVLEAGLLVAAPPLPNPAPQFPLPAKRLGFVLVGAMHHPVAARLRRAMRRLSDVVITSVPFHVPD